MKKLFNFFLILFFSYLFSGCDEDEISINNLNSYLKLFSQYYENVLKSVNNSEFSDISNNAKYGLSLYTITYKTTYLGEEIIASGLVSFPNTDQPVPMLSFHHGTESSHIDAPSDNLVTYSFFSNAASLGYIFLMPDYLGFGSSKAILHPYYRSDIIGNTVVDMLKAGAPPIWTRVSVTGKNDDFIDIHMFGLNDGEDVIVADRIKSVIANKNN